MDIGYFVFLGIGFIIGFVTRIFLISSGKSTPININNDNIIAEKEKSITQLNVKNEMLSEESEELKQKNQILLEKEKTFLTTEATLKTEAESRQREIENQKTTLNEMSQRLKIEFENMANKIFKATNEDFQKDSKESLETLLTPLNTKIKDFEKSVDNFKGQGESFKATFEQFTKSNNEMKEASQHFREALQGSTKTQGDWGEFVLETILEKSGLRKNEEYFLQKSVTGDQGQRLQPDVIVNLPENKQIVIDAKTSISHYITYSSETDDNKKIELKKQMIQSVKKHIETLSKKQYPYADALITPEFILMFIPSEPVFSLALQDKQLFEKAWENKVVIVSPITLYASLKTIASIWRIEKQNKNAEEIAKTSGQLYDKFCSFLEDLNKIDKNFQNISDSFDSAKNKLRTGRGNLIDRVEKIRKLGAKTSKEIPASFSSQD